MADIMCPDKRVLFDKISLSRRTMTRRVSDMADFISNTLLSRCPCFTYYSVAVDESTDTIDTAQLAVFRQICPNITRISINGSGCLNSARRRF